jgi:alcohol dehydrogenase class IV
VYDTTQSNPSLSAVLTGRRELQELSFDCIVAIGGGSTIDTAKALAPRIPPDAFLSALAGDQPLYSESVVPVFAIPTIVGSGSEITRWATIWDYEGNRKLSLESNCLYPRAALYLPSLLESVSDQSITTSIVDAISHCFDSLWNKHRTSQSQALALAAIPRLMTSLPRFLSDKRNCFVQREVIIACLQASLAFSQTKTSLAHAISYSLTLQYGVPHGIATSCSLPAILESVQSDSLQHANGPFPATVSPEQLRAFLSSAGVYRQLSSVLGGKPELNAMRDCLLTTSRASNFSFSAEMALENTFSQLF